MTGEDQVERPAAVSTRNVAATADQSTVTEQNLVITDLRHQVNGLELKMESVVLMMGKIYDVVSKRPVLSASMSYPPSGPSAEESEEGEYDGPKGLEIPDDVLSRSGGQFYKLTNEDTKQ